MQGVIATSSSLTMAPKWTKAQPRNRRKPAQAASYEKHVVSKPGSVEMYLIAHGATSLPSKFDGSDPLPFASVKSIANERDKETAQAATLVTVRPTHSPVWEETLTMEIPEEDVNEEELIFTIADNESKEKLVTYRVPINNFVPFHPYHLELIQPTKSIGSGVRAYVSVQRLESYLPRLASFGFCGLEVILSGFHKVLDSPVSPLLAVARIVPDYSVYKERILMKQAAGITTSTVTLPSPHPSAFEIPDKQIQGFPQITTASNGGKRPVWDHTFMFTGNDTATMFTTHSALVLEYYTANTSMSSITWIIRNPVGFSTLLLDDEIFNALRSEEGKLGVKIEDLLIQSTDFFDSKDSAAGVDLYLRLINSERPDTMVTVGDFSLLPTLTSIDGRGKITPDVDPTSLQPQTPDELPTSSAVENQPHTSMPFDRKRTQILTNEDEYPPSDILESLFPDNRFAVPDTKPSPKSHRAEELKTLKETVRKMSVDIARLKSAIAKLQDENRALKKQLFSKKNLVDIIQSDLNTGELTVEELAEKYIATKAELESESAELKKYQDKVQQLQNQLIKANDREKKYLSKALSTPSEVEKRGNVDGKQDRIKKLENTAVQQEKVIAKMEKLLADCLRNEEKPRSKIPPNRLPEKIDRAASDQATTILMQENSRLRMELEDLKLQQRRFDIDNSHLQANLDQAHNRVTSLEQQLNQNSRQWAQEKHELTVRLQEHRNGIIRTQQPANDFLRHSYMD